MKFKVGDRVSVYAVDYYLNKAMEGKGVVARLFKRKHLISVDMDRWDPPGENLVHPKQCRKLVRKKSDSTRID